jgi:spermidine/putrescine transport system permease protein
VSAMIEIPGANAAPLAPATSRRPRHWGRFILPTYSWLIIAYLVFPIAVMFVYSFNKSVGGVPQVSFTWNGFTTSWYHEWNSAPGLSASFWLSIRLALIATVVSTVLGTLLAMALVRYRPKQFRGKGLIEQVLFVNIAAPEIVMGASLLGLFVTFNIGRGFLTLVLAHVMFWCAPAWRASTAPWKRRPTTWVRDPLRPFAE